MKARRSPTHFATVRRSADRRARRSFDRAAIPPGLGFGHVVSAGTNSVVLRGRRPGTVTKVFRDTAERAAREAAEVEWRRLQQLHTALAGWEGVGCPRPVAWGDSNGGGSVTMEEVSGEDLHDLASSPTRPIPMDVARRLAVAVEAYARVFAEPHFDHLPKNILVAPTTSEVTVLDFEPSDIQAYLGEVGARAHPAVTTSGILLGSALHHAAAPRALLRRDGGRWLVDVAVGAIQALCVEQREGLTDVTRAVYRMNIEKRPAIWRRWWYGLRWYGLGRPALRRATGGPRRHLMQGQVSGGPSGSTTKRWPWDGDTLPQRAAPQEQTTGASLPGSALPEVSVIIPAHNSVGTIGEQLDALARQSYTGSWEVIVVDDCSTDGTGTAASHHIECLPSLRIVRTAENRNAAHARNIGVAAARGRRLLFCDADDVVDDRWIEAMVVALREHSFVAGRMDVSRLNPPWLGTGRQERQYHGLQAWEVYGRPYLPHAGAGTIGMWRHLYEDVGPFDERFDRCEGPGPEYCFRVQLAGYSLRFAADAVVHLRLRPTLRSIYRQSRDWAEWTVALEREFASRGMPRSRAVRGVAAWTLVLPRLLQVRSRGQLVPWVRLLAWRVGRLRGSVRFRYRAI